MAGSGAHRILRSARIELRAAARRYEEVRIGLGEKFVLAIDKAIGDAIADPLRWPLMPSFLTDLGVRRRLVDGFPYAVVYRIVANELVEIVAVMHGKRSPDYWKDRR